MARGEQPLFSTPSDETEAGQMPKKVFRGMPEESAVGDVVMAWLDRIGIDKRMVTGFSTFHHVGEVPRIMLEMYFDDTPQEADVTGIDKAERETVPTVSRETSGGWAARMVGERGPEINISASHGALGGVSAAYANAHADGLHRDNFSPNCPACQMDKKEG